MSNGMICVNDYWDNHYANGGKSSDSNINEAREWKMNILYDYGLKHDTSIIDIGCGDMDFWNDISFTNYTGIDISPTIIEQNRARFPNYTFYCSDSSEPLNISSNYVTCFDMLFHIMDTEKYIKIITNLSYYANNKLFIYTWQKNPFESFKNRLLIGRPFNKNIVTDNKYQYYRDYDAYSMKYIEPYFKVLDIRTDDRWPYGAMYIYERREPNRII
jgi:hypothetical protein